MKKEGELKEKLERIVSSNLEVDMALRENREEDKVLACYVV